MANPGTPSEHMLSSFREEHLADEGSSGMMWYRYKPLATGQTRLVHLKQETQLSESEGLYCVIQHVDVSSAIYTALSYEWGSSEQPFSIPVRDQGESYQGSIPLTRNLRNALADLMQSTVEPKTFWIDQMCIDQNDVRDKSAQIPLMGSIYRKASQVLTYLGPSEPADDEATDLMRSICQHYQPMLEQLKDEYGVTATTISALSALLEQSPDRRYHVDSETPAGRALHGLMLSGWLKRRWMIQENVLNCTTSFLRGPRLFSHADGILTVHLMQARIIPLAPEDDINSRATIANYAYAVGGLEWCKFKSMDLRSNLWWFSQTQCHDPRDRIFALLGISSDASEMNITVDYDRTEVEVLVNVGVRLVECHGNIDFLQFASSGASGPAGLPSWVPYWDTHVSTYPSQLPTTSRLRAAGDTKVQYVFGDKGRALTLNGLRLGTLQESLGAWSSKFLPNSYQLLFQGKEVEEVRQKLRVLNHIREQRPDSEQWDLMLAQTLVRATRWPASNDPPSTDTILHAFRSCLELLERSLERADAGSTEAPTLSAATFSPPSMTEAEKDLALKFMKDAHIINRSFWTLLNKFICLAPALAEASDEVIAFLGGRFLYILRPTGEEGQYRFIGTAYVQGFMEGWLMQFPAWEKEVKSFMLI